MFLQCIYMSIYEQATLEHIYVISHAHDDGLINMSFYDACA